ncbi:MAG TPA: 3-hydroxyacyl-CoA dehydrogenase family protein [Terracidiphilus sp.]|nr:3-hydroxyacyl-CoA dehydrogenase family protein [Terracidiphilus sp.]
MSDEERESATKLSPIGVIGLGRLGRGIVAALLGSGRKVIAFDTNPTAAEETRRFAAHALEEMKAQGCSHLQPNQDGTKLLSIAASLDEFAGCEFLIESVVESAAVKELLFDAVEGLVDPKTVIASNTSALPITGLQRERKNPERFVGMHWAEPAYATRFLEVIRGEQSADWAVEAALGLGTQAGKQPCLVKNDLPGFIVNRLGYALYREAAHLLELGVGDVETIDRAFRNAVGLWATLCGPFRWIDITGGVELYARAMTPVLPTLSNVDQVPANFAARMGDSAEQSFYNYGEGEREQWQKLLHEHAWEMRRVMEHYDPLAAPGKNMQ